MTVHEARQMVKHFYSISMPDEDDIFMFTEAMGYLIHELKDPGDMMELGGFYYGEKRFDLALKYYEMAAEYDYEPAYECLGYIWYYGRTGTKDYKKAFEYYSKSMEKGNVVCAYKVADMYKNGYYVEKDYGMYVKIIEDLYSRLKRERYMHSALPDVYSRLAGIRAREGNTAEALRLYRAAKQHLARKISYNDFFGDISVMKWIIDDIYALTEFDKDNFDFYDMFWLFKKPCTVTFTLGDRMLTVKAVEEEGEPSVYFDGKWFRTRTDFFQKASLNGEKLTSNYYLMDDFRVEE